MATTDDLAGWLARQARPDQEKVLDRSAPYRTERPSISETFPHAVADSSGCYILEEHVDVRVRLPAPDDAQRALLSELRLLYGIGRSHSHALREAGFTTLHALRNHPRWGEASAALLGRWGVPPDPAQIYADLSRWLPSSSSQFLTLLGLYETSDLVFFDLETLGLSGLPVFLGAVGRVDGSKFVVRQYLAPSPAEEVGVLDRLCEELEAARAWLSFNGKSFDANVLRERCAYYGLPWPEARVHVDLLHQSRREFRNLVDDCHLGTIERDVLAVTRKNDLPSDQVPFYYTLFLETGSASVLEPILSHNRQDLISLALLAQELIDRTHDN